MRKASIHGPNRKANRIAINGDNGKKYIGSTKDKRLISDDILSNGDAGGVNDAANIPDNIDSGTIFRIRCLEKTELKDVYGNVCVIVPRKESNTRVRDRRSAVSLLRHDHDELIKYPLLSQGIQKPIPVIKDIDEPVLIHFHDFPVFVLRAVIANKTESSCIYGNKNTQQIEDKYHLEEGIDHLYLSEVQRYNNKVCEDTLMKITCCTRLTSTNIDLPSSSDYDSLAFVGVEVHLKNTTPILSISRNDSSFTGPCNEKCELYSEIDCNDGQSGNVITFSSKDISKALINHTYRSVLSNNELLTFFVNGHLLTCRIVGVQVATDPTVHPGDEELAGNAAMEEPWRGRVTINTSFCISAADHNFVPSSSLVLRVRDESKLEEFKLPDDIIHVTTSDDEWYPVKRQLLAPCLKLTKYVQSGRGKYAYVEMLPESQRSEDAPIDDGRPHCRIDIDCCTFDRVILFILSLLYPNEKSFLPGPSEMNDLAHAADVLALQPLADLCSQKSANFDSRVRKDDYFRLAEIQKRNNQKSELILILDGMVLDVTRWLDEHPGGPSIIPAQALNMDCTVFFEMYHVSRQSFLYLESFYIGELDPNDFRILQENHCDGVSASEGFLEELRSYTKEWRINVQKLEGNDRVFKSF
mmetsp:Transcript_40451/g.47333  ORF Transcript_40451/g.47333 Transcript_40451/m.47333 type:complete len:640 (-) Transcript_40451:140-2059(-)